MTKPKLAKEQQARALCLVAEGVTQSDVARMMGVTHVVIN